MFGKRRQATGFTLIELLVVVSIIAMLVLMLLPMLGRARDLVIRASCMANFKAMSRNVLAFAATHNGRGPAGCWGASSIQTSGVWGRGWADCVNVEILGQGNFWTQQTSYIQMDGCTPTKGWLYCPSEKNFGPGALYIRAYYLNRNITGIGSTESIPYKTPQNSSDANYNGEKSGRLLISNPSQMPCQPIANMDQANVTNTWTQYILGPYLESFSNTGYKFMTVESEAGNDVGTDSWPDGNIVLGSWVGLSPPWEDSGGSELAFRHTLPPDMIMYQQQASAVYSYIDGHVDWMNAIGTGTNDINKSARFSYP
jgi:prepilin-type N-terminal cleavage/methylation domain-containing protein